MKLTIIIRDNRPGVQGLFISKNFVKIKLKDNNKNDYEQHFRKICQQTTY
jgi:hypothetical protein